MLAVRLSDARNSNVIEFAKYNVMVISPNTIHSTTTRMEPRREARAPVRMVLDWRLVLIKCQFVVFVAIMMGTTNWMGGLTGEPVFGVANVRNTLMASGTFESVLLHALFQLVPS